jgi:hypothetical protein
MVLFFVLQNRCTRVYIRHSKRFVCSPICRKNQYSDMIILPLCCFFPLSIHIFRRLVPPVFLAFQSTLYSALYIPGQNQSTYHININIGAKINISISKHADTVTNSKLCRHVCHNREKGISIQKNDLECHQTTWLFSSSTRSNLAHYERKKRF